MKLIIYLLNSNFIGCKLAKLSVLPHKATTVTFPYIERITHFGVNKNLKNQDNEELINWIKDKMKSNIKEYLLNLRDDISIKMVFLIWNATFVFAMC